MAPSPLASTLLLSSREHLGMTVSTVLPRSAPSWLWRRRWPPLRSHPAVPSKAFEACGVARLSEHPHLSPDMGPPTIGAHSCPLPCLTSCRGWRGWS